LDQKLAQALIQPPVRLASRLTGGSRVAALATKLNQPLCFLPPYNT
jgi:hypothetical protein